jgi:DNA-binding CsgD family transcriptional regulator
MVRGWLEVIPDEVVRVRPVLSVGFAGALLSVGELEGGPGCSWRDIRTSGPSAPFTRRSGSWTASCERRNRARGREASSRSWSCWRSRTRGTGDIPAALFCLERAVTLAEPEGYARVFADEGPPMASLLRVAARQQTAGNYVRQLLAAVTETEQDRPVKQALIEPLSERELDVLRLLGTELDGPAIARELMVSLNTVRTHTKHIYAKLAVTNRRAAVRRAAELDLPRTRNR